MKIILMYVSALALFLLLSGCSDDNSKEISSLKSDLREAHLNLRSCQSSLETYRNIGTSSSDDSSSQQEESAPPEKSCDTKTFYQVYIDGKFLASCETAETTACGLKLSDCEDGFGYECLKSAKYNTKDKEICN